MRKTNHAVNLTFKSSHSSSIKFRPDKGLDHKKNNIVPRPQGFDRPPADPKKGPVTPVNPG